MTISLLSLAVIIVALAWRASRVPFQHRWRQRQVRMMCQELRGCDRAQTPALIYARLRAMDALAFEDLLLESFERRGHRVVRNHRYTGDGGVYGQVVIAGQVWLIQAKRYAGSIRAQHIRAFVSICATRNVPGLFVHTGRTGGSSRGAVAQLAAVDTVSGQRLLALITGCQITLGGKSL